MEVIMKKFLILFILLFSCNCVFADNVQYPANARYVIVNPNDMVKSTFLLDTKTGKTWNLVEDSFGVLIWQQMEYDWYKSDGTRGGLTRKTPLQLTP